MYFEIALKELIKEKYGSVRSFSQAINIPYSTIDNIFKRGIMGVSIQIVLRICEVLNIDIEKIKDDTLVLKEVEPIDDEGITLYKSLNELGQAEIRGEMKQMLKADKYKRSEDTKHKDNINSKEAALRNYIEHLSNSGTVAAYGGDGVKTVKGVTPEAMELIKKILDNS